MGDVTDFRPGKPKAAQVITINRDVALSALPERGSPQMSISAADAASVLRKTADDIEKRGKDVDAVLVVAHFSDEDELPLLVSPAYLSKIEVAHVLACMITDVLIDTLEAAVNP